MNEICPALRREKSGAFICSYVNTEINPGIMPCLENWAECPIYAHYSRIKPKETEIEKTIPRETVVTEVEEKPEVKPVELVREEISEEEILIRELSEIERRVIEITNLWDEYQKNALSLIQKWDQINRKIEQLLSGVKSSLEAAQKEVKEIQVRFKLGLISEDLYNEAMTNLDNQIEALEEIKNNVEESRNRVFRMIMPHIKRIKATEAKPEVGKLRMGIIKLDQMFKEGKISEDLYKKLRTELERKIRELEEISKG